MAEKVNHPPHYGGDVVYEAIKVISAWGLGFTLGNAAKYICRAGRKEGQAGLLDLRKAAWYLNWEIARLEAAELIQQPGKDKEAPPLGAVPVCARCRQPLHKCRKWAEGTPWRPAGADPLTSPCERAGVLSARQVTDAEISSWLGARGKRLWCSPVFAPFPAGFAVLVEDVQLQSGLLLVRRAEKFEGEADWPNEPFYVTAAELTIKGAHHGRTD